MNLPSQSGTFQILNGTFKIVNGTFKIANGFFQIKKRTFWIANGEKFIVTVFRGLGAKSDFLPKLVINEDPI